jgi:hypothetical protein
MILSFWLYVFHMFYQWCTSIWYGKWNPNASFSDSIASIHDTNERFRRFVLFIQVYLDFGYFNQSPFWYMKSIQILDTLINHHFGIGGISICTYVFISCLQRHLFMMAWGHLCVIEPGILMHQWVLQGLSMNFANTNCFPILVFFSWWEFGNWTWILILNIWLIVTWRTFSFI